MKIRYPTRNTAAFAVALVALSVASSYGAEYINTDGTGQSITNTVDQSINWANWALRASSYAEFATEDTTYSVPGTTYLNNSGNITATVNGRGLLISQSLTHLTGNIGPLKGTMTGDIVLSNSGNISTNMEERSAITALITAVDPDIYNSYTYQLDPTAVISGAIELGMTYDSATGTKQINYLTGLYTTAGDYGSHGIYANNSGTDAVNSSVTIYSNASIETNGLNNSGASNGSNGIEALAKGSIAIYNGYEGADASHITTAGKNAHGIHAFSTDSSVQITSASNMTFNTAGVAIFAEAASGGVQVESHSTIESSYTGILIRNNSGSDTGLYSVIATGDITATVNGIEAKDINSTGGVSLSYDDGVITSENVGIAAWSNMTSKVNIDVGAGAQIISGLRPGEDGYGIFAQTTNKGDDAIVINNAGTVNSTTTGIYAVAKYSDSTAGGAVTINNTGTVEGATGIYVAADARKSSVENQGTVRGTGGVAISVNSWDSEVTLGTSSVTDGKIVTGSGGTASLFLVGNGTNTLDGSKLESTASTTFNVVKQDSGTWTITGMTDVQTLAVNAGRLVVDGAIGVRNGNTEIASNAILKGTGSITGHVNFNADSVFEVNLADAMAGKYLTVGTGTLDGIISFSNWSTTQLALGTTITVLEGIGADAWLNDSQFTNWLNGAIYDYGLNSYTMIYDNVNGEVRLEVVGLIPEPATASLGLIGLVGLMVRRRRQNT